MYEQEFNGGKACTKSPVSCVLRDGHVGYCRNHDGHITGGAAGAPQEFNEGKAGGPQLLNEGKIPC